MSPGESTGGSTGSHHARSSHHPNSGPGASETEPRSWCESLTPHILVVDDEPPIRALLREVLKDQGYQVSEAGTGEQALQVFKDTHIQILLTDLKLPDMDGITLLEQILDADPKVSGIVMTGYGTIDLAIRALRAGAVEFLTKPLQPEVVLLTLQRQVKLLNLRQENALLKKAMLKSGGIRVRQFQPGEGEPGGPGGETRTMVHYERGVAEGERRAQVACAKERALVATLVRELERVTRTQIERIEDEAASLAFDIACKVVHDAARERRDMAAIQAREAVARAQVRGQGDGIVQIRVHPDDVALIQGVQDELADLCDAPVSFRIEGVRWCF